MNKKKMQILFLPLVLLFMARCTQKGEDSIYILPENYTGYVVILYNQAIGEPKKYIKDKRVYEVPLSGVLKTQFSADYGETQFPEVYYGHVAEGKQIPVMIDWKDFKKDKVNATLPSIGKAYNNLDGTGAIEYATFLIGTKNQVEQYSKELTELDITDLAGK